MILVVLSAYNESVEVPELLQRFDRLASELDEPLRIIVVDDGSTDGTDQAVRGTRVGIPVELLVHPRNLGLGAGLLTGLRRASETASPEDAVVTLDADNTHDPRYVVDLRRKMNQGNLDVVVASRYAGGGKEVGVSLFRRILSHGASWIYRSFFRTPGLRDFTCGYRMFRAGILQEAFSRSGDRFIEETSFAATGEIILKIRRLTDRFGEVPFVLRYDMKHTKSKMAKLRTVVRTLCVLWKHR
jgi:dolichol-phosphate mannosyltransferase